MRQKLRVHEPGLWDWFGLVIVVLWYAVFALVSFHVT